MKNSAHRRTTEATNVLTTLSPACIHQRVKFEYCIQSSGLSEQITMAISVKDLLQDLSKVEGILHKTSHVGINVRDTSFVSRFY
jgi:hypothetical protein